MTIRFEWAHARESRPGLLTPDEIEDLSEDGNDAADWGICAMTGSNGFMLYGDPGDLEGWLVAAREALSEPLRKFRNKQAALTRKEAGLPKCKHEWMLTEQGYSRCWGTTVDKKNKTITATFDGTSDFSEEGEGEYLECTVCGHVKYVGDDWEVDFR